MDISYCQIYMVQVWRLTELLLTVDSFMSLLL